MRARGLVSALLVAAFALMPLSASAQIARQADPGTFTTVELVDSGHRFFGTVSRGLALTIQEAVKRWGEPNGYILGQEASGAFIGGLRYGEGTLYTRNVGERPMFWQGPSVGFDFGGEGARTMMLVYNMPATEALYKRFLGDRRLGLFRRRLRDDGGGRGRDGGGADPLRRRRPPRRQHGLPQVHRRADLEPLLSRRRATAFPGHGSVATSGLRQRGRRAPRIE